MRKLRLSPCMACSAASGLLWLLSLWLPAVALAGGQEITGLEILLRGWQASRVGVLAWYANPLFIIGILVGSFGNRRAAALLSGLALVVALTSFAAFSTAARAGAPLPESEFRLGFFVWLAALVLFFFVIAIRLLRARLAEM